MRKFILSVVTFAVIIFFLDRCVGILSNYFIDNIAGGEIQRNEYICDKTSEDILIFGSSRAARHYDPRIIKDSLSMSCYNCAYDGCGSITAYGLLRIILERYTPKIIIYDVCPDFDYFKVDGDNTQYLGPLKYYFDRSGIDTLYSKISIIEKWKMESMMYRYNSKFISLILENIRKNKVIEDGYLPLRGSIGYEPNIDDRKDSLNPIYDELKIECMQAIISLCKLKNIQLILCSSPSYKKINDSEFDFIQNLATEEKIPFINYYCFKDLVNNKEYFKDSAHLNEKGATVYTRIFVGKLKNVLNL